MTERVMRVLHLISDHKLTGPAETVLLVVRELRAMGLDVMFSCSRFQRPKSSSIEQRAAEFGIEALTPFILRKHFDVVSSIRDAPEMAEFIDAAGVDVLHANLLGDHVVAGWASRKAERGVVVRSVWSMGRLFLRVRARVLTRRVTDAVVLHSEYHKRQALNAWPLPKERILTLPPPVELERFSPERVSPMKERFGFSESDVLAAVVGRVQKRRRLSIFFEALRRARQKAPELKGVVIGRGTHLQEVAEEPVRRLGLEHAVHLAGYLRGGEYANALATCDVGVHVRPGTDETARALRELMAAGTPVIVGRTGMLGELLLDGESGFVVDEKPERFAEKLVALARDATLRRKMGEAARRHAEEHFSLKKYAAGLVEFYERLLRRGKRGG